MPSFTYDITLATWRDYARWRLDDTDPEANNGAPFIYDETYDVLYITFGPIEGLARAASQVAVVIAKGITSFGEAAGIRFTLNNLKYFQELPDLIRSEPAFDVSGNLTRKLIKVGAIDNPTLAKQLLRWGRIFNVDC